MLHRNGTPPASDLPRTTAPTAAARTEFLPDRPTDTLRTLAYQLSRQQLVGVPLIRWLYGLLLVGALLLPFFAPASGWWGSAGVLLPAALLWSWQRLTRAQDYIRFTPEPHAAASITPRPLAPVDKLPVYVTGTLSVERKVRHFAALPGFYRTFATREHALLCQVRPRRLGGVASWPEEEEGLWYAFFYARQVRALQRGTILFDRTPFGGFMLEYEPDMPLDGKSKRRQRITLYLAFPHAADCEAALADLLVEPLPVDGAAASAAHATAR
jgi:hypothetical protein